MRMWSRETARSLEIDYLGRGFACVFVHVVRVSTMLWPKKKFPLHCFMEMKFPSVFKPFSLLAQFSEKPVGSFA